MGVAALSMLGAACGSGDDEGSATTGTSAPVTTSAETAPPDTTIAPATTAAETTAAPTTAAPTTAAETTVAPTTEVVSADLGDATCRYLGVDDFEDMQVELAFTNPVGDVLQLDVTYTLVDAAGVEIVTNTEIESPALADEQFRIVADTLDPRPPGLDDADISCRVEAIEEQFSAASAVAPTPDDTCVVVATEESVQVNLAVANPFGGANEARIRYGVRGDDVRFGASSAGVEFSGPGASAELTDDSFIGVPEWAAGSDVTCDVLWIEDRS